MNERIKELAEQAGFQTSNLGWVSTDFNLKIEGVDVQEYLEKFAELIVKECADAADMAYDARCSYPGDYVGEYMGYGEEHGITAWRLE